MKFKLGDKVKIIDSPDGCWNGKICKIIKAYSHRTSTDYAYRVQEVSNTNWNCPMMEKELESVLRKGEQLLLFEL